MCEPLTDNQDDISNFASNLASNFMGVVQYNKDNRMFEVSMLQDKITQMIIPWMFELVPPPNLRPSELALHRVKFKYNEQ